MNGSKWNYIAVGTSAFCAFIGALDHSLFCVIFGLIWTVVNWHYGDYSRKLEDVALIFEYEMKKEQAELDKEAENGEKEKK